MAIRFCDKEVYCVNISELSRSNLLSFFFKNDLKDIVYVTNDEGKFEGIILYKDFVSTKNIEDAIHKEKVVFNEDLWENARNCFKYNSNIQLLPVVNKYNELEYFCYNDPKQNHLINKIRRLSEVDKPLLAVNKYSNIECVNIYDLNEVSFYLYQFLRRSNITVNPYGEKWNLLKGEIYYNNNYMDSSILNVYSEGVSSTRQIKKDINELLLNDISGFFEFVDDIYRENLISDKLNNIESNWDDMIKNLRNETRPIIIEDISFMAERAYDFFIGNGIYPKCFCTHMSQRYEMPIQDLTLFGIPIYSKNICIEKYPNAIYILVSVKEESVDRIAELEYQGYCYGKDTYDFTSYISSLDKIMLTNIISTRKIILMGDSYLCGRLYEIFKNTNILYNSIIYYCYAGINMNSKLPEGLKQFNIKECSESHSDETYFILDKTGNDNGKSRTHKIDEILKLLKERKIKDISLYFWYNINSLGRNTISVSMGSEKITQNRGKIFRLNIEDINKVILGITPGHSGNVFIWSLLEVHPDIIVLPFNLLSYRMWYFVEELSDDCKIEEIPDRFIELISMQLHEKHEKIESIIENVDYFKTELVKTLENRKHIYGQELFVAICIAHYYMRGGNIRADHP